MPKIKAVLFDLDDTLFDCSGTLVKNARKRAAAAMVAAGLPVGESEALGLQEELSKNLGPMENIFDRICDRLGINGDKKKRIVQAGFNAYNSDQVESICLFPDVLPTLAKLRGTGIKTALVTSGIFERQRKKIESLGLEGKLDHILIRDTEKDASKEEKFIAAIKKFRLRAGDAAVVGDRIHSEIKLGNKLGMTTIRILHGRFKSVKPRTEFEEPDYTIKRIG
ncbi:MAG: HAD hydrolase-like protein, partial [Candidatus Diapherotrites archaeon]|nr:HAD hydrolase-like protein [Candidatus Diapherotrites archaeon]